MREPRMSADSLFVSFQLAVAGRYSIDREIGRGGMGVVYLAREVHLDRLVAIKLLPPDRARDPALRERFLREARLAAKLSHPNIIPIHAVDESAEFVYFVMAFVDGETLADRVRTRGPLTSSEASRVLREAAWALAYAHGQGLVHRDVKPDNILLEHATGRVLVADFGIAAASGERGADGVTGTPEFMSPEQVLGGEIDARSDLYGLGATAFFAISGRLPFEGSSPTEVLAKQVTELAPPLASLGINVSRKLALLVDRCLAKEPNHRPASAHALAEQLGVALEQRREIPIALRAFVKRNARLDGSGTLLGGVGLFAAASAVGVAYGGPAGLAALAVSATAAPFVSFVDAARRVMRMGFGHSDLDRAFAEEIAQARAELAVDRPAGAFGLEKILSPVTKLTAATFAATVTGTLLFGAERDVLQVALFTIALSGAGSILSAIGLLALRRRHRDVETEFWAKLWKGRIGRAAFSVAKKLLGRRPVAAAMTHRATELSLGMAAEQLYESLPKDAKQRLAALPELLRRLQDDAQTLRRVYDELQDALADAGDAAASSDFADVRATRDQMHDRLRDAVRALEAIRLNLLRLHAGSLTVEGLTTDLGLASEISEEVERLIASHHEVDESLRFPREIATTPV